MERCVLAIDLGGTKVLCQVSIDSDASTVLLEREYPSAAYADFDSLLAAFLAEPELENCVITHSCFAIAGPVTGQTARVTNLPWQLDVMALCERFDLGHLQFCNDFEAVARGIPALTSEDMVCLQQGESGSDIAVKAVIGAGTGLGQAVILPETKYDWHVMATEGGHVDFAPRNELQMRLLSYALSQFEHVSYERLVSGAGLELIYRFLIAESGGQLPQALSDVDDGPAWVSQAALSEQDAIAVEALALFVEIYGAQAGNLALNSLAYGGVYIAGGIAAKNLAAFQDGRFMQAFLQKGKMSDLVAKMPVYLILQPKVGLMGARLLALQSAL